MRSSIVKSNYRWNGSINKETVKGAGTVIADSQSGLIHGFGHFDDYPEKLSICISGACYWCISCSNDWSFIFNVPNIVELTGGNYRATRRLTHFYKGEVVGKLLIEGDVKMSRKDELDIDVKIEGDYRGPNPIQRISDYYFKLSAMPGKLSGNYIQSLFLPAGPPVVLYCEVEYEWDGEKNLNRDVYVSTHYTEQKFNTHLDRGNRFGGFTGVSYGIPIYSKSEIDAFELCSKVPNI